MADKRRFEAHGVGLALSEGASGQHETQGVGVVDSVAQRHRRARGHHLPQKGGALRVDAIGMIQAQQLPNDLVAIRFAHGTLYRRGLHDRHLYPMSQIRHASKEW